MKKLIFIGALILTLSSCTNTPPTPVEVNTGAVTGTESVTQTGIVSPSVSSTGVVTTGSIVTVNYTLHVDTPTGKVEDTSLEEVARANGLYRTGGTYQPLQVVIGQQQVIPGFENGLIGMKKGEKKSIQVLPQDGYGKVTTSTGTLKEAEIAPEFTLIQEKKSFGKTVSQTIQKSTLDPAALALLQGKKVGDTLTGGAVPAKIIALDDTSVTLEGENKFNPFAGKELKVGATAQYASGTNFSKNGVDFLIEKIDGEKVTVRVINHDSPFYGKAFVPGATATIPEMGTTITIDKIGSGTVDITQTTQPNHPLASKTLFFDVEVMNVE